MKKLFYVPIMVAAVVLVTASMSRAAEFPNLLGNWDGAVSYVGWNESSSFYYASSGFPIEIQIQDFGNGNFYGLMNDYYPFTGNVSKKKVVTIILYGASGDYKIITGKVSGNKMTGTMQHFKPGQVDTGTFTLYKQGP
ncbi:MAG: hypothetical protein WHX93_06900 [bacterium]